MKVGVGYSENPNSRMAGTQASEIALEQAQRSDPCDLVLLFSTARHDEQVSREAVAQVTKTDDCIFGGGAVGIITNQEYGYAGDQVGIACIWLDGTEWNVFTEEDLTEGEEEVGLRLGKRLAQQGIQSDSPVMLFYDAVDQTHGDLRLIMATWILEGLKKGLGFLPDLTGAGLQGDHLCTPVGQFVGDRICSHQAMAMTFSEDIQVDNIIMHGCRPASTYYTVTKAEGPVILEIDGEPTVPFIDRVLDSAISPEEYPFFLLFGLNYGDRWGLFDEDNYASRLCLGLDKERNGIVMFEPDMVVGTEFQIMFRSLDLEYMKPKIEKIFDDLGDREPVFAMYIDCAGRCAGYGGIDLEDAVVVQEAINGRVPLLGLYTGVEIASIAGHPRGLDWTGVFCLFSQGGSKEEAKKLSLDEKTSDAVESKKEEDTGEVYAKALKRLSEQNAAKVLKLDTELISIRYELEQKRRGFSLLAELSESLRQTTDYESILSTVTRRINAALNMQRTIILSPGKKGLFTPTMMQGYSADEEETLKDVHITVDEVFFDQNRPVLVTGADDENYLGEFRETIGIPYFISVPVVVRGEIVAFLITGRLMEATPFLSRLGQGEAETIQAVSALMVTVIMYQRLEAADKKAQIDPLTGLYNRSTFEYEVSRILERKQCGQYVHAFLMIDFDNFKAVNDTYGHHQGDVALKTLANVLCKNFRSTDIVSRLGGDEFAVFCPDIEKVEQVTRAIDRLNDVWRATSFVAENGEAFNATLSLGIALAPQDGLEYRELYQRVDIALYKAKEQGRNRYVLYDGKEQKGW